MSAADIFGEGSDFVTYRVELQIRELMVGGVPGDASVIRKWLAARMELGDAQIEELVQKTLAERDDKAFTSTDEAIDLVLASESAPSVNGFKRLPSGELAYEGRCLKAALKEWANSAYPGNEWPGKTAVSKGFRKGLMSTLAERVFIDPYLIGLGVKEPTRVEERIKHVMTPQGPRSSINRVEVIERPTLVAYFKVRDDFLPTKAWARIWETGEEIGLGADRGRSDGRFDLVAWETV